jgi:ketosteroid isomerase-like protein
MSGDRLAILRSAVEAFNRGDWDGFLAHVNEGFTLDLSRATGPEHGVFTVADTRALLERFAESWESVEIEIHEMTEVGEHVVAPQTMHARGRDGIDVPSRVTWVWTFGGSEIVHATMYQDSDDALEAVGLGQ